MSFLPEQIGVTENAPIETEPKECALFLPAAVCVALKKTLQKVLDSRRALAVTECARGSSFMPIRRKWEGPRRGRGWSPLLAQKLAPR